MRLQHTCVPAIRSMFGRHAVGHALGPVSTHAHTRALHYEPAPIHAGEHQHPPIVRPHGTPRVLFQALAGPHRRSALHQRCRCRRAACAAPPENAESDWCAATLEQATLHTSMHTRTHAHTHTRPALRVPSRIESCLARAHLHTSLADGHSHQRNRTLPIVTLAQGQLAPQHQPAIPNSRTCTQDPQPSTLNPEA